MHRTPDGLSGAPDEEPGPLGNLRIVRALKLSQGLNGFDAAELFDGPRASQRTSRSRSCRTAWREQLNRIFLIPVGILIQSLLAHDRVRMVECLVAQFCARTWIEPHRDSVQDVREVTLPGCRVTYHVSQRVGGSQRRAVGQFDYLPLLGRERVERNGNAFQRISKLTRQDRLIVSNLYLLHCLTRSIAMVSFLISKKWLVVEPLNVNERVARSLGASFAGSLWLAPICLQGKTRDLVRENSGVPEGPILTEHNRTGSSRSAELFARFQEHVGLRINVFGRILGSGINQR